MKIQDNIKYHGENALGVQNSHPIQIAKLFNPSMPDISMQHNLKYTISGLAKLLLFEHFVRAHSNGNASAYVAAESIKFPYAPKKKITNRVI